MPMTKRELERLCDLLGAASEQEWADEHSLDDDIARLRSAVQEQIDLRPVRPASRPRPRRIDPNMNYGRGRIVPRSR